MYKTFDEPQDKADSGLPTYLKYGWGWTPFGFLERLVSTFGWRFVFIVFACYHVANGLNSAIVGQSKGYMFEHYGVNAADAEIMTAIEKMTWAFLPILGVISDIFPIFGFQKAPYMFFFSVVGCAVALLLALDTHFLFPVKVVVMFFFFISLQGSVCTFLLQAQIAVKITEHPKEGPTLIMFKWIGSGMLTGAAAFAVPVLLDGYGLHSVYWVCAFASLIAVWPLACNYLGESQLTPSEVQENQDHFTYNRQQLIVPSGMLVIGILLILLGNLNLSATAQFACSLALLIIMCECIFLVMDRDVALVAVFFAFLNAVQPNIDGAEFYFWNDTDLQYPEGPHVDKETYITAHDVLGSYGSMVGLLFYYWVLKNWRFRTALMTTQILIALAFWTKIFTYLRLNLYFGIPDQFMLIASEVAVQFPGANRWILLSLLMMRMCPAGQEGSTMAILLGADQLGHTVSKYFGSCLFEQLGVLPAGNPNESAQFENLWVCVFLQGFLPMLWMVLFAPIMVPDATQTEVVLGSGPRVSGAASLLAQGSAARGSADV
mmetsp:Transcript_154700/g.273236  ORF Transcript_154700/g.273236 Transcript_154700/m.273236 type:complete len:546 (+) Transcript_154700:105-1742(+)